MSCCTSSYVFVCASCLDRKNINVILDVWLCWTTLEGARLLELHSSVSVASGMSHHE